MNANTTSRVGYRLLSAMTIAVLLVLTTEATTGAETATKIATKEPTVPKESSGLKVLEEFQQTLVEIAERVKPAVVNISPPSARTHAITPRMPDQPGQRRPEAPPGSGTGVIISKDGIILTNNHVVGGAKEVEVRLSDKRRLTGKVVGNDPDTDLAVIKVTTDKDLPYVSLGDSSKVKVGQIVIAVGNPFGLDRTVTMGVVSAMGREGVNLSRYEDFIQTDASINPGNSGGPLLNIAGEVIGINTAIINFAQGIGFAIPSSMAQSIATQLVEKGKVTRGWLGVGIQPVTENLATKFGVREGEGVLINEVFQGDPADKAGIQPGDIIVKVNGKDVDTPSTLSRLVAGLGPGREGELEIIRDRKRSTFKIKLGERKDEAAFASLPPQPEVALGLNVQDLTPELSEKFKLKDEKGVLIAKVEPGSPAEDEGLREGDLIKEFNREKVTSSEDFNKMVRKLVEGESLLLRVVRESRAFFAVLKPAPKEK